MKSISVLSQDKKEHEIRRELVEWSAKESSQIKKRDGEKWKGLVGLEFVNETSKQRME